MDSNLGMSEEMVDIWKSDTHKLREKHTKIELADMVVSKQESICEYRRTVTTLAEQIVSLEDANKEFEQSTWDMIKKLNDIIDSYENVWYYKVLSFFKSIKFRSPIKIGG